MKYRIQLDESFRIYSKRNLYYCPQACKNMLPTVRSYTKKSFLMDHFNPKYLSKYPVYDMKRHKFQSIYKHKSSSVLFYHCVFPVRIHQPSLEEKFEITLNEIYLKINRAVTSKNFSLSHRNSTMIM